MQRWSKVDESEVVDDLAISSKEFFRFYKGERPKIGLIKWYKNPNLERTEARSGSREIPDTDIYEHVICLKRCPPSVEDVHIIAHEIMHCVRAEENKSLSIKPVSPDYGDLAESFGSMLDDSLIDSILKENYNLDLLVQYKKDLEKDREIIQEADVEPTDHLIQVDIAIILTNQILKWDLVKDKSDYQEWTKHLALYDRYNNIKNIRKCLLSIIQRIGLNTPEKQRRVFSEATNQYGLNEFLYLENSKQ